MVTKGNVKSIIAKILFLIGFLFFYTIVLLLLTIVLLLSHSTPFAAEFSVATFDDDYSKAYGGAGVTSVVSSVGGTLGDNTQRTLVKWKPVHYGRNSASTRCQL
jgi:hypothetical protein